MAKKMAKKCQKVPKRAKIRFPGSGRPCLRAGPKGQPQARRRCGPEGPAPEAPRLPAEGRQASMYVLLCSTYSARKENNKMKRIVEISLLIKIQFTSKLPR